MLTEQADPLKPSPLGKEAGEFNNRFLEAFMKQQKKIEEWLENTKDDE